MTTTLIGAGDIIDRSTQYYRLNLRRILTLAAPNIILGVIFAEVDTLLAWLFPNGSLVAMVVSWTLVVPALFVSVATYILLVRELTAEVRGRGQAPTISWRAAIKDLWQPAYALIGSAIIIFLGLMAFVVPGIVFWTWFCFAPTIAALGIASARKSLTASRELSAGRFAAIFWRLAAPSTFFFLLQLVLLLLVTLLLQGAVRGNWSIELLVEGSPLWLLLVAVGIHEVIRGLLFPLFIFPVTLLYLALTDKKDPASLPPEALAKGGSQ